MPCTLLINMNISQRLNNVHTSSLDHVCSVKRNIFNVFAFKNIVCICKFVKSDEETSTFCIFSFLLSHNFDTFII